jgi:hypothetical protein
MLKRRSKKSKPASHEKQANELHVSPNDSLIQMESSHQRACQSKSSRTVAGSKSKLQSKRPSWSVSSWLLSLDLLEILANSLLNGEEEDENHAERIQKMTDMELAQALTTSLPAIKHELLNGARNLRAQKEVDAAKLNAKFVEDGVGFTFTFATMETYHGGLEGLIGKPDPKIRIAMEDEHLHSACAYEPFGCLGVYKDGSKTTASKEWDYCVNRKTVGDGKRDEGRANWSLQTFLARNGKDCMIISDESSVYYGQTGRLVRPPTIDAPPVDSAKHCIDSMYPADDYTILLHASSLMVSLRGDQLAHNDVIFRANLLEEEGSPHLLTSNYLYFT